MTESELEHPAAVVAALRRAVGQLGRAHAMASERDGARTGLNGPWRDLIFGLNTAADTVAQMVEDRYLGGGGPDE